MAARALEGRVAEVVRLAVAAVIKPDAALWARHRQKIGVSVAESGEATRVTHLTAGIGEIGEGFFGALMVAVAGRAGEAFAGVRGGCSEERQEATAPAR